MGEIEAYIRAQAVANGIDPDIAVRVAKAEGGLDNLTQQSYVRRKDGSRETSYGPFQLLIGGGLGDVALSKGIDPRKESDWRRGVDLALSVAGKEGWGQWYGARDTGIGNMEGITGKTAGITPGPMPPNMTLTTNPVVAAPAAPPAGGSTAPSTPASGLAGLLQHLVSGGGGTPQAQQAGSDMTIAPSSVGASTGFEGAAQAAALMADLMEGRRSKRRRGLSLMGGPLGV